MSGNFPESGGVLGIDVGWSADRETTGFCLLSWSSGEVRWQVGNAGSTAASRGALLETLKCKSQTICAVAIDGPLRPGLVLEPTYRTCEALLSRGSFQKRGKPGQSSAPVGRNLHAHATTLAKFALENLQINSTALLFSVHDKLIVEAFPNSYLGVLCDEAEYPKKPKKKRKWTDALFPIVKSKIQRIVQTALPGRKSHSSLDLDDHEHIAGFACALTALGVVSGQYVAAGSEQDGYIVLPAMRHWGSALEEGPSWAARVLSANLQTVRVTFPNARIISDGADWNYAAPALEESQRVDGAACGAVGVGRGAAQ